MIRYTTPAIPLLVEGKDLTQGQEIYVSMEQGPKDFPTAALEKRDSDLTISTETHGQITDTSITFTLTQEESAMFNLNQSVEIQVNWINASGVREATEIKRIPVMRNLLDRVIAYGD